VIRSAPFLARLFRARLSHALGLAGSRRAQRTFGQRQILRASLALVIALLVSVSAEGANPTAHAVPVRVGEVVVLQLSEPYGKADAVARARSAEEILEDLVGEPIQQVEVKVLPHAVGIFVGTRLVIELGEADRDAAGKGDLVSYGQEVARKIRAALDQEHRRAAIAGRVLSFSSVVFLGLMALLLLRAVGNWSRRAAAWIELDAKNLRGLKLHTVELLNPSTTREGLRILLQGAFGGLRLAIVFGWVLTTLSFFDSTRGLAQRATGKLFAPGLEFLERLAAQVPVLLALFLGLVLLLIAVRFTLAYFAAVARGELESDWARPETAFVTGRLVATAILLSGALFVAPLLTGSQDGIVTRLGVLALAALALASTPLFTAWALGVRLVYGGAIRIGDSVQYGGQAGRVEQIGLFELILLDDENTVIRVPHLMSLWHSTRVTRRPGPAHVGGPQVVALASSAGPPSIRRAPKEPEEGES
jgi:small-conductance mechanosensitive channel